MSYYKSESLKFTAYKPPVIKKYYGIGETGRGAPANWGQEGVVPNWDGKGTFWEKTVTTFSDGQVTTVPVQLEKRQAADLVVQAYPNIYFSIADWCDKVDTTIMSGSEIVSGSITTLQLNTDSIKNEDYIAPSSGSHFSQKGSFFDLSNGNITTPSFSVDAENKEAYFKGNVTAESGNIGGCEIINGQLNIDGIVAKDVNITGTITAENGQIGNFSLVQGTLKAGEFELYTSVTEVNGSEEISGYLKFENGTEIKPKSIDTESIVTTSLTGESINVNSILNIGSMNFKDNKVSYGEYYFGFNTSNTQTWYAEVSYDGKDIRIDITDSNGYDAYLPSSMSFTVYYTHTSSPNTIENRTITVGYGSSYKVYTTQHLFPVGSASFSSTNKQFTKKAITVAGSSGILSTNINFVPESNKHSLGDGDHYWGAIYCEASEIDLSDKNAKNTIIKLSDCYSKIFDKLQPVSYKFNNGASDRTHIGFIAQDVEQALLDVGLTTKDFAGICYWDKEDGTKGYGLRYGEFIALNTHEIQKLKKRVAEQDQKILELEEKLLNFQNLLETKES